MSKTHKTDNISVVDGIKTTNGESISTTISCLPNELLASVVRRFDIRYWKHLELVNRQFRDAVLTVWKEQRTMRLEYVFGIVSDDRSMCERKEYREQKRFKKFLKALFMRSPHITELEGLSMFSHHLSRGVVAKLCQFEKLERLSLQGKYPNMDNVALLLSRTRSSACIRHLSLNNWLISDSQRLSETIKLALSRMTLHELVFRNNYPDEGKCLSQLNCEQLRLLNVARSRIDTEILNQLLIRCKKLTHLDISSYNTTVAYLSDEIIDCLRNAKGLVSLKMNGSYTHKNHQHMTLPVSEVRQLLFDLGSFGALTELEMVDSCLCTDAVIDVITIRLADSLKKLRIDIKRCSEAALLQLALTMVNLEELVFWSKSARCHNVSSLVVEAITANLSKLVILHLSRTSASADALKRLITLWNLRDLTVIDAFDDPSLTTVASALGHQLTTLNIPKSSQISDEGLIAATNHLPNLKRLDLEECRISDKSLTHLARSCSELRCLNLRKCLHISVQGAKTIVEFCSKIERLCVSETQVDVFFIKKYHRNLHFV